MKFQTALFLAASASASPLVPRQAPSSVLPSGPDASAEPETVYNWSEDWQTKYPIHESCNATQHNSLEFALGELVQLAQHARDHILRFGHKSDLVTKYFGNGTTSVPIGWFDRVVAADKSPMVFRCDDPDNVCCDAPTWGGHWRGENATEETVICPRSFHYRKNLQDVCSQGYTIANGPLNTYWAVDLLHRVLHVPTITEERVEHHSDGYLGALQLAKEQPELSGYDSDVLQMFAIDAWAYDIAVPGVGCTGEPEETEEAPVSSSASTMTTMATTVATEVTSVVATATGDAEGDNCHTHADGTEHCV